MCVCVCVCDSQSLSAAINEGLAEALVLWNGLQNGSLLCHVANGPLPQPCAAQSEYVPTDTRTHKPIDCFT